MACLAQLLAHHRRILVLDAASMAVQIGLLRSDSPAIWRYSKEEAGRALFIGAEACLREASLILDDINAFVFCEGPGSMLGIRTAAMTLRTWQVLRPRPAYSYQSLTLLAHDVQALRSPEPFSVITDARRNTWNTVSVDAAGKIGPIRRMDGTELAAGSEPIYQSPAFRTWAPPPRAAIDHPYTTAALLEKHADRDLLTAVDSPDTFQYEAPEYKKWSAQPHSAETATRK